MKLGDRRAYKSHSGKRWIIQVRTRATGMAAAFGAESQWSYEGHSFPTEVEARKYLRGKK